jgi:AcrR family transcriptional regulator
MDGRVQRSERSREAIVIAMLGLIGEGTLSPTAQQVAERAEVGVRTVFRHFSDMETLFAAMNDRLTEQTESLFVDAIQEGPFADRVEALVERRISIFEELGPYMRAAAIQRRSSAFLQSQHGRNIRTLRRDLRRWLPEIDSAPREAADALEMILSFEAWNRLRIEQRLARNRAAAALRSSVSQLTTALDVAG